MRKEIKFELTKEEYHRIYKNLNYILKKDPNMKFEKKYSIKTIYFDNIYNKLLYENIDGVPYRKKFRIRMYNDDINTIFLEKKIRDNNLIYKEREKISYEEVKAICEGKINSLKLDTKLKKEFYIECKTKLLKPVIVIEYDRIALENKLINFRITLDSNLYRNKDIRSFFKKNQKKDNMYILEVKYLTYIPKAVLEILEINGQRSSISKYRNMRLKNAF